MQIMDIVDSAIERYAAAHTTGEPEHLRALAAETQERFVWHTMMIGPVEGRFLQTLVWALHARRVLEIGTFTGYSALSMAGGLAGDPPDGGHITTCELNPEHAEVARRHIAAAGLTGRITVLEGPALATVQELPGPWDFVFIDADKASYGAYYEAALTKLAPRGMIAVDNTLWSGRVLDDEDLDDDTAAIRAFNDMVAADPRVIAVQATVRDGVTLIRRA